MILAGYRQGRPALTARTVALVVGAVAAAVGGSAVVAAAKSGDSPINPRAAETPPEPEAAAEPAA
jgi:hypothetical protein